MAGSAYDIRGGARGGQQTFLALKQGLQNALWQLGGVPRVIRSDNTSALTHEIKRSRGRALNDNYAELLDHYGLESTLINAGESHENGVAEQAHYRLKDAIGQALMLRGSRDFSSGPFRETVVVVPAACPRNTGLKR